MTSSFPSSFSHNAWSKKARSVQAVAHHVKPEAVADILTLGKMVLSVNESGDITTAEGLTAADWLDGRKTESPYWWEPARSSGGANGRSARGSMHASEYGPSALPIDNNP